jgi:hypothetical protein
MSENGVASSNGPNTLQQTSANGVQHQQSVNQRIMNKVQQNYRQININQRNMRQQPQFLTIRK